MPEPEPLVPQQLARTDGLFLTLCAQIDILPTCEPVFPIPYALAVAEQNDPFHTVAFSVSIHTLFVSLFSSKKS